MAKKKATKTGMVESVFKYPKALLAGVVLGIVALSVTFMTSASADDSTVVVTADTSAGENQPGWLFNRDVTTSTPYEFNENAASVGDGSLYVLPIGSNPSDKFIAEYFYLGPVSAVNSFSYDFQIGADDAATQANQFYLNVYTNLPEQSVTNFYDCRFDYVPTTGSTTSFTTFTVDENTVPVRVQSRGGATCPSPSEGLAGLPDGSTIRVFSINVGDTSVSDEGLDGYVDNVVVDTTDGVTVYDFEALVPLSSKDQCKDGGWETYGFRNQGLCIKFMNTGSDTR